MAESIRIEMNRAGIIAALQAPGVRADLLRRGNEIKGRADAGGGTHEVSAHTGRTRVRISVITADLDARMAEAVDRNLLRALGAAGGAGSALVSYTSAGGRTSMVTQRQADNYRSRGRR